MAINDLPKTRGRIQLTCIGFAIAVFMIFMRAYYVQIIRHSDFQGKRDAQSLKTIKSYPSRGRIIDTNGLILAESIPAVSIWLKKRKYSREDPEDIVSNFTAAAPGFDREYIVRQIRTNRELVLVGRRQAPEITEILRAQLSERNKTLIIERPDWRRHYPFGPIGSSIIGGVGADLQGLSGAEYQFESQLKGKAYDEILLRTAYGASIDKRATRSLGQDGADIHLSLDISLQRESEAALAGIGARQKILNGATITLEASTGQILAAGAFPTYDLRLRTGLLPEHYYWSPALRNRFNTPIGSALPLGVGALITGDLNLRSETARSLTSAFKRDLLISNWNEITGWHPREWHISSAIQRHRLQSSLGIFDSHAIVRTGPSNETLLVAITPIHLARILAELANGGNSIEPSILKLSPGSEQPAGTRIVPQGVANGFSDMLEKLFLEQWGDFAEIPGCRIGGLGTASRAQIGSDIVFVGFVQDAHASGPIVTAVALKWLGNTNEGLRAAVEVFRKTSAAAVWSNEDWPPAGN